MAFIADAFDGEAIQQGRWCDYEGSQFLVARVDSDRYRKALGELVRDSKKRESELTVDELGEMELRIQAEHLLVDWKGVVVRGGDDLPYSADSAYRAMKNDRAFRQWVIDQANDYAAYRHEDVKESEKKP